jgi:CPA2 family monovalent cation:H+ antiporter-2
MSAAVIFGKTLIVTAVVLLLRLPTRVALPAALTLAQVGEFSFVLAVLGVSSHAILQSLFGLVLATSLVTVVLSPLLLQLSSRLVTALDRHGTGSRRAPKRVHQEAEPRGWKEHTVIAEYGRVGREVGRILQEHDIPYLVIERNPATVEELREGGVAVIYGDAGNPTVLEHAHLEAARLFAVLIPHPVDAELATRTARAVNPKLAILTRAPDAAQATRLRQAGATDVVQPEFEAGLAVLGYALRRYGLSGPELAEIVLGRRARFYRRGTAS